MLRNLLNKVFFLIAALLLMKILLIALVPILFFLATISFIRWRYPNVQ